MQRRHGETLRMGNAVAPPGTMTRAEEVFWTNRSDDNDQPLELEDVFYPVIHPSSRNQGTAQSESGESQNTGYPDETRLRESNIGQVNFQLPNERRSVFGISIEQETTYQIHFELFDRSAAGTDIATTSAVNTTADTTVSVNDNGYDNPDDDNHDHDDNQNDDDEEEEVEVGEDDDDDDDDDNAVNRNDDDEEEEVEVGEDDDDDDDDDNAVNRNDDDEEEEVEVGEDDDDDDDDDNAVNRVPVAERLYSNFSNALESREALQCSEAQLEALKKDPMGINFDRPLYPDYSILALRIRSFFNRPASMTQTASDLARAGFFYDGQGDGTRCFFCGEGLRNWEPLDIPWVEHAKWFPNCPFVLQNQGQDFIDQVRAVAELEEEAYQQETSNTQINSNTDEVVFELAKEEKVMPVDTLKEVGDSENNDNPVKYQDLGNRRPSRKQGPFVEKDRTASQPQETRSDYHTSRGASSTQQSNNVERARRSNALRDVVRMDIDRLVNWPNEQGTGNTRTGTSIELTSLKKENSSLKDEIFCKICMEKKVSIVFLPCGHLVCCQDCSPFLRKCLICQQLIMRRLKTFLV